MLEMTEAKDSPIVYTEIHVITRKDVPLSGYFIAIYPNGNREWFHDGIRDRPENDGPAIECSNGLQIWVKNDEIHRFDGPAIQIQNNIWIWYQYGKIHRTQGPAYIDVNGTHEYWVDGERVDKADFAQRVMLYYQELKMKII